MLHPAGEWFDCREMGSSFEPSSSPAIALGMGKAGMALGKGKQPKEGATLLVLTPGVCQRVGVYRRALLLPVRPGVLIYV